jgi:hypothetical protein
LLRSWVKRKGAFSIYADAMSFEDVASNMLTHSLNRASPRTIDDSVTLRPTWGFVLFTPPLVWLAVTATPWDDLWSSIGIQNDAIIFAIYATTIGLLLYVWIWQAAFHRVTYDHYQIEIIDDFFRKQKRDLNNLTGFVVMEKRPVFELTFNNAKPLRIVSNISYRDRFLNDMQTRLDMNTGKVQKPFNTASPVLTSAPEPAQSAPQIDQEIGKRYIPTKIDRF